MNVFHKVSLQSLKKNKTRTIVTIIGIMLSAAMICAVTSFVSSMQNYALNYAVYTDGDWHGSAENVDLATCRQLQADVRIGAAACSQILGYAKIDSQNEYKPYLYVIGGEADSFFEMMPVHLISGRYPRSAKELILPEHCLSNGGLKYTIGDTITLSIGDRLLDGVCMGQDNPSYVYDASIENEVLNDETIEVHRTCTYTIVGVYERPSFEEYTAPGYTAITLCDEVYGSADRFDVYFKMKKPAEIYDFMAQQKLSGSQNTDVLMYTGVSKYSSFSTVLYSLALIVIGLIMFGSVSLIYNAFSISVSERTKQFGLLSSIGTTKKQLRKMVLFEALAVGAIGIPLGIGVGLAGIAATLILIGSKFTAIVGGYEAPMRICVSWESIVIAAIVALITVLISAWIPSKRATKVSAVEAIRQNADIKASSKPVKTSKLIYKLFGLPGVLASKHYKRNRKKYRTTVISLFMSIVLFVSASAFTDYLMESVAGGFGTNDYALSYWLPQDALENKSLEDILALLCSDKNVTGGAYTLDGRFDGQIPTQCATEQFLETLPAQGDPANVTGYYHFINDSAFLRLLDENRLDKALFYNPAKPLGLALDTCTYFDPQQEKFISLDTLNTDSCEILCRTVKNEYNGFYHAGDTEDENGDILVLYKNPDKEEEFLEVPYAEACHSFTLQSAKAITAFPFYIDKGQPAALHMIYPLSMIGQVLPEEMTRDNSYTFYLQSKHHAASYQHLQSLLIENNLNSSLLTDYAEQQESRQNTVTIIQVFSYGFIVLISLIAATNVFNTISTNISLRRREFAMLKSVGMTQKGFQKMMNFECLLYCSRALLFGLPVSAGMTYLIYRAISNGFETTYHLPWGAIGIAAFSVFLVVFATMLYSMGKIKKDNPIDALKNENL